METNYGHLHPFPSRDKRVCWNTETNYGHLLPFAIQRQQVRWHAERNMIIGPLCRRLKCLSTETILVSLCYPETIKSDGTQRQICGHLPPLSKTQMSFDRDYFSLPLLSRANRVRWHAETNYSHPLPFAIQRQSSLMACRDKYGHIPPLSKTQMSFNRDYCSLPLSSRDSRVR